MWSSLCCGCKRLDFWRTGLALALARRFTAGSGGGGALDPPAVRPLMELELHKKTNVLRSMIGSQ